MPRPRFFALVFVMFLFVSVSARALSQQDFSFGQERWSNMFYYELGRAHTGAGLALQSPAFWKFLSVRLGSTFLASVDDDTEGGPALYGFHGGLIVQPPYSAQERFCTYLGIFGDLRTGEDGGRFAGEGYYGGLSSVLGFRYLLNTESFFDAPAAPIPGAGFVFEAGSASSRLELRADPPNRGPIRVGSGFLMRVGFVQYF